MLKPKVFITTDAGGSDPDDLQSLMHLLWYSDVLDIVGICCGHPRGKVRIARNVISAYKADYKKYKLERFGLIDPKLAHDLCFQGSQHENNYSLMTGSRKLVKASKEGPLLVLVWGACTDLAAAIKHGLNKDNVAAHVIASWNREKDPRAFKLVKDANLHSLIVNESTFRGMYLGAGMPGRMGNRGFVEQIVKPCGEMGQLFYDISRTINVGSYSLKAGDTGSTIWALDEAMGNRPRWGGYFPNGTDSTDPQHRLGVFKGAALLAKQRKRWLGDWINRLERFYKV
jgi:hypothetical protein